jgi:hypothetical protein
MILRHAPASRDSSRASIPAGYYLIGASQQGKDVLQQGLLPSGGDLQIEIGPDGPTVSGRVLLMAISRPHRCLGHTGSIRL